MNDKPLTGARKRQQITKTNQQMLIWVAIAALVVTICAVLAFNFTQRIIYQAKVNNELAKTSDTLTNSLKSIPNLISNVNTLQTNQDLLALRINPTDTAFQVVLDALPTVDDSTSLASSLQQRILGPSQVAIQKITVTDQGQMVTANTPAPTGQATNGSTTPTVGNFQFSFTISGDLSTVTTAIQNLEKSIRPITINTLTIQAGSNGQLQVTVNATTYYLPSVNYQLDSKEVQP